MVRVLVIWNEIPDSVSFVQLDVDAETAKKIEGWHCKFINATEYPPEMVEFFYDADGKFKYEKTDGPLKGEKYKAADLVVITGFLM